jgi:epoxyqueuosine reductase
MSPDFLTSQSATELHHLALERGFDVAGWCSTHIPAQVVEDYQMWLERGRHAGMDYLERQLARRSNLAPYTSVLVLGISHAFAAPAKPAGGTRVGRVARYAWTPDYHAQLEPRLAQIVQAAEKLGLGAKAYVDHGPILERFLGARAFLGWRGKSGMLVSQKFGAFLSLAVVLIKENPNTNIPVGAGFKPALENSSHPDRCGRCTACVRACPTSAILENRTIDANKCISYLTIEHRGPIPKPYRRAIGDWLLGCDGCLEVCPWSAKAGEVAKLWEPDPELVYPDLEPFFTLSSRQFEKRYAHSAFSRPRRKGMARNACVVLGNSGDVNHLELLNLAAQDEAWEVREAAAWALGELGDVLALERLCLDAHPQVRETALEGMKG